MIWGLQKKSLINSRSMPSSSWQPAACKEQQTSCRACNNSSTAFDPLCTIWKLCTLKTPWHHIRWECTEYAVTSSSHILPFKTFKDCFFGLDPQQIRNFCYCCCSNVEGEVNLTSASALAAAKPWKLGKEKCKPSLPWQDRHGWC